MKTRVVIIGAGPAGLTAGYLLSKEEVDVVVLEADPVYVGGISRTVTYKGFHFDIGGHRFFSKSKAVEDLWTEILPNDMLVRPRSSRIFYNGKFFSYPLKPFEALLRLGLFRSTLCILSWMKARLFPVRNPRNFEEWVSNQFGKRLFNTFFKSYTEKVWGMSCKEISADWAAQRIKGISLGSAIKNAIVDFRCIALCRPVRLRMRCCGKALVSFRTASTIASPHSIARQVQRARASCLVAPASGPILTFALLCGGLSCER